MTDGQKRLKRLPAAACVAVAVSILGFIYSMYFKDLFEQLHWYSFSADAGLSREDFNRIMSFITVALVIYYTLFLVVASLMILKSKKHIPLLLVLMALLKLCTLILMFRPGRNMVFQLGFESVVEIIALLSIAYMYKNIRKNAKLYDSRVTICIIGAVAEITPFLRNLQFMFYKQTNVPVKLCIAVLPCATAAFFVLTALKAAGRKPVRKMKAVKSSSKQIQNAGHPENKTVPTVSRPEQTEKAQDKAPAETKTENDINKPQNTDKDIDEDDKTDKTNDGSEKTDKTTGTAAETNEKNNESNDSPADESTRKTTDETNIVNTSEEAAVNKTVRTDISNHQHLEGKKTAVVKKSAKTDDSNAETKIITVSGKNSETRTITVARKKSDNTNSSDPSPDINDEK